MVRNRWLDKLAEINTLPYEDVAELAHRWSHHKAVSAIEVSAVLLPVLDELLGAQGGLDTAEILKAKKDLRCLALSNGRHSLREDFEKLLRRERKVCLRERELPSTLRAKLRLGTRLTIVELDVAHLWAIDETERIAASAGSDIREQTIDRWTRYAASRMFTGPHRPIENPEALLRQMAKRARSDDRRTKYRERIAHAPSEVIKTKHRGRPPRSALSDDDQDEAEYEKLSLVMESLLRRLRLRDRTIWRGRNPKRITLLLEAAKSHIDGQPSDLGEAVCSQMSAGLFGRRGKRGSLKIIERELSRKDKAVAVRPGTMRRTIKKLRHAIMHAAQTIIAGSSLSVKRNEGRASSTYRA